MSNPLPSPGKPSKRPLGPQLFNVRKSVDIYHFTLCLGSVKIVPSGKRALKRLANHLADVHELSSQERQPYLIRAKPTALDLENVLAELYRLIGNSKKQSKWNKSGIKNIPIRQPKSSRKIENKIEYKICKERGQYRNE